MLVAGEWETPTTVSLRGISGVDDSTAWASGARGTVLIHTMPEHDWRDVSVPSAQDLDFRAIHAFDDQSAVVLSAGSPAKLFRTENRGQSWSLVYEDARPGIFFDAMRFADDRFGMAFSDPIDGRLQLISTNDGGRSWQALPIESSPETLPGEAGFAASNSGLAIAGNTICIGLGGATSLGVARVALSGDRGATWSMTTTPMRASESSGVFSIALDGDRHGVAVGGDYLQPDATADNVLITADGGRTWIRPKGHPPGGYRSCVAFLPAFGKGVLVAVGPNGADVSNDYGQSWSPVELGAWHAAGVSRRGNFLWMSGPDGRVGSADTRFLRCGSD